MKELQLLQRAVNYMEEHLLEPIDYGSAAHSACMSEYSFHQIFSVLAGMTANEYIRKRRLSQAGQELQSTDISVLDAAFKYGYDTPEGFSKAFFRFHGITPRQARRKGTTLCMFNPLFIKITMEGGTMLNYRLESRGRERFLTVTQSFPNTLMGDDSDHSIPDFWGMCDREMRLDTLSRLRPAGKRDLYGLCSPAAEHSTHFRYGIGVALDDETDASQLEQLLTDGYSVWEIEPAEYAVFQCMGDNADCIGEMWSRFYKEFIPQSGYAQSEKADFEVYFEKEKPGVFCELWIPVTKA